MSFKENLLKKIKIDQLSVQVADSLGPSESGRKLDKESMRNLLKMAPYNVRRERDLELYIKKNGESNKQQILVLDNDLTIYTTTVSDVALRKSPTVKEMINIRNAIKILNDSDVVKSKKETSLHTIQKECIEQLDLDYSEYDIEKIQKDGQQALEIGDSNGVMETLTLFQELLNLSLAPKAFKIAGIEMIGKLSEGKVDELYFGPFILYNSHNNEIKLILKKIGSRDKVGIDYIHQVVNGQEKPDMEGYKVFEFLKDSVMGRNELS